MLSRNSLRIASSSRAVLNPSWPITNRLCGSKSVTCLAQCMSTSLLKKDIWQSSMNPRAPGKDTVLIYYTNQVKSLVCYSTSQVKLNCWNCKQPLLDKPPFFCMSCKVVQPPEEGTCYFKIMDCDYTFTLDTHKLQQRYLQLQRSLHPDNFSQKSVKEQEYSESQSALVNKAYNTLLKPLSRGLYMLRLEGMHIEEGTESGADSEFLFELLAINEALDEAWTPEEANKIGRDTKGELQAAKALLVQMKYYANIEEKVKEKLSRFM
ncbi:iron-sulfur cluster co-chaperone protein HscB isoform X2 [Channa argus]|uniref:iron-sulfur cluster co-chaperone protein HscB isoform X2 n=1 Tax=Channa argus TaxID=215402 RepID=UPI003521F192